MAQKPVFGSRDNTVTKVVQVQGVRVPVVSASMDRFLEDEDLMILYERWQENWPAPVGLRGGGVLIRTNMVREVDWKELSTTYGPKRAKLYRDIAERYE